MLVLWAPVGGPAADLGSPERGPVARAAPVGAALLHEVSRVRAPAADQNLDGATDAARQPPELVGGQLVTWPERREAGPPQDLVHQEVAETGQPRLVHEPGLERGSGSVPHGQDGAELADTDPPGLGSERGLVGVELGPAKTPGVVQGQLAAPFERDAQAHGPLGARVRRVAEALDRRGAIDDEAAGHPEAQAEHGTAVGLRRRVDQEQLPPPADSGDAV